MERLDGLQPEKQPLLKNKYVACAAAVFCTLLWGTAFPFIKLGYSAFEIGGSDTGSKLLFAGLRFFAAGAGVLCFTLLKGKKPRQKTTGRDISSAALLGLVQTAAQYIFTYIGIGFTSGKNTSIITACASFVTVLAAPLFFKSDRLGFLKILGCAAGFCGVLAVNGAASVGTDTLFGDFMILLSAFSAAAGNLISKKAAASRDPVRLTAHQLLIGGAVLLVIGLLCGGRLDFSRLDGVLILIWLAFVSAAAFSVWTALLKYHPAGKISIFNLLVPVFGTILSGLLLGESVFGAGTFISLALICTGIALVNLELRKR